MARANRHYIPGQIWHITHRCHERDFLLKLARDRRGWAKWLREAKGRYALWFVGPQLHRHIELCPSHGTGRCRRGSHPQVHAVDRGANRPGIQSKKDPKRRIPGRPLPCTAIEAESHLLRCLVDIGLNMVRAGVVSHPSQWPDSGYNEIRSPLSRYFAMIAWSGPGQPDREPGQTDL